MPKRSQACRGSLDATGNGGAGSPQDGSRGGPVQLGSEPAVAEASITGNENGHLVGARRRRAAGLVVDSDDDGSESEQKQASDSSDDDSDDVVVPAARGHGAHAAAAAVPSTPGSCASDTGSSGTCRSSPAVLPVWAKKLVRGRGGRAAPRAAAALALARAVRSEPWWADREAKEGGGHEDDDEGSGEGAGSEGGESNEGSQTGSCSSDDDQEGEAGIEGTSSLGSASFEVSDEDSDEEDIPDLIDDTTVRQRVSSRAAAEAAMDVMRGRQHFADAG